MLPYISHHQHCNLPSSDPTRLSLSCSVISLFRASALQSARVCLCVRFPRRKGIPQLIPLGHNLSLISLKYGAILIEEADGLSLIEKDMDMYTHSQLLYSICSTDQGATCLLGSLKKKKNCWKYTWCEGQRSIIFLFIPRPIFPVDSSRPSDWLQ